MRGLAILSVLLIVLVAFWWVVYLTGLLEVILGAGVLAIGCAVAVGRIRRRSTLAKQQAGNRSPSINRPT